MKNAIGTPITVEVELEIYKDEPNFIIDPDIPWSPIKKIDLQIFKLPPLNFVKNTPLKDITQGYHLVISHLGEITEKEVQLHSEKVVITEIQLESNLIVASFWPDKIRQTEPPEQGDLLLIKGRYDAQHKRISVQWYKKLDKNAKNPLQTAFTEQLSFDKKPVFTKPERPKDVLETIRKLHEGQEYIKISEIEKHTDSLHWKDELQDLIQDEIVLVSSNGQYLQLVEES